MREPETYEGCCKSYVPWMKAVKEYITVRSMDFRDDTTKICWLGSLLKGEAQNWHQNHLATAEKELQPDTWAAYNAAMDYSFHDPYEKRTFTTRWQISTGSRNQDMPKQDYLWTNGVSGWPCTKKRHNVMRRC
jgi:hypothetical protein